MTSPNYREGIKDQRELILCVLPTPSSFSQKLGLLCLFARTTITKCHRLVTLNNRN